ncbi:thymidylate kinase-domain-containing protein [Podospora appendiculata]|uniref:Thymidylate kinase n=1 Tax=Podospora appendiculata TaxID=314037 RepID=A0AAE0X747_9PEZI|nr:thymidylate kinase-domain-containing protein [Podospora appendiculata]
MASINDLATAAVSALAPSQSQSTTTTIPTPTTTSTTTMADTTTSPVPPVARGALVVLEGLDRSGKTTQVKLLEQRFVELGKKVKVMRFPDRTTPIGQMIDSYLKSQLDLEDHVIHLLFSANRWEAVKTINNLLTTGTTVLCDRYYHSGIVYSAAKHNPSLPLSWARAPEVGLPRPDLVLFLDLDEAQAKARGGWGGEVYERGEMQRRVRELFWGLSMGKIVESVTASGEEEVALGAPSVDGPVPVPVGGGAVELRFRQEEEDLHVVDASSSVEEVAEEVWRVVGARVESVERGEVGKVVRRVS